MYWIHFKELFGTRHYIFMVVLYVYFSIWNEIWLKIWKMRHIHNSSLKCPKSILNILYLMIFNYKHTLNRIYFFIIRNEIFIVDIQAIHLSPDHWMILVIWSILICPMTAIRWTGTRYTGTGNARFIRGRIRIFRFMESRIVTIIFYKCRIHFYRRWCALSPR